MSLKSLFDLFFKTKVGKAVCRHTYATFYYPDKSSYAICENCGDRIEPIQRDDGCTPLWDAPYNGYKCGRSSNYTARSWSSSLCPSHSPRAEKEGTS